jgi:thiamine transporter
MGEIAASGSAKRTRIMVEGALCVALSVVFSYLKLFSMPQGGSLTLEMAPLFYFSYRRGYKWGCAAGGISGILQMIFGGYVAHPVQAILDYPAAFACMGLSGAFGRDEKGIAVGTILAGAVRFVCHVLSGVIFFASYAPEGQNVWAYSAIYNASFMLPSLAVSGAVAWIAWKKPLFGAR